MATADASPHGPAANWGLPPNRAAFLCALHLLAGCTAPSVQWTVTCAMGCLMSCLQSTGQERTGAARTERAPRGAMLGSAQ